MIAHANDDGGNGGPEGLALRIAERSEGGVRLRLCLSLGPLRIGSVPIPPELLARCVPLAADGGKEGA